MVYITGDTHTDWMSRFNEKNFPQQKSMTKSDYVIVCGDFGIWDDSKRERDNLDALEKKSFTTLFVDGNHSNFDIINRFPVEEWHGGTVHKIRPTVIHLMRGQVFEIDGFKYFTFGGACSHDIEGGILNPEDVDFNEQEKKCYQSGRPFRIIHQSWWPEEMPSEEEMAEGLRNLNRHHFDVDYVITHCAASSIQTQILAFIVGDYYRAASYKEDNLTQYFEKLECKLKYRCWYFGHYHDDINWNKSHVLLYHRIIENVL